MDKGMGACGASSPAASGMEWTDAVEDAVEDSCWAVSRIGRNDWELNLTSDAGEDFWISVTADSPEKFAEELQEAYASFDPEDHAAMWFMAGRGGSPRL